MSDMTNASFAAPRKVQPPTSVPHPAHVSEPEEAPPIELDNLLRNDDKLYLIERLIEQQAPLGADMANFRRRLLLVVRA